MNAEQRNIKHVNLSSNQQCTKSEHSGEKRKIVDTNSAFGFYLVFGFIIALIAVILLTIIKFQVMPL